MGGSPVLVGVDVGGTFTDAVCVAGGAWHSAKVATTPHAQDDGVIAALSACLATAGCSAADVRAFGHGTTAGTNALLERRGAVTALVATAGFEHVLWLARQDRPHLYRPCIGRPEPLVPLDRCHGLDERITPRGIARELHEGALTALVETLAEQRVEAVAVCLLHAYADPRHEERVAAALREALPAVHVSVSSELAPEVREYERASTVAADAYLGPVMSGYLARLGTRAVTAGLPAPRIVRSSGGLAAPHAVARHPSWALLSGPAAGAAGAALVARAAGVERILTFDMGGTSCDVALAGPRGVELRPEGRVGGLPIRLPMLDIVTVGAGGGSYAWLDAGGALRIGPESAGAAPGPACYGRGGTRPTVTDAHAVLRHLPASLAGGMRIATGAAERALAPIARQLGLSVRGAADAVLAVADAELVRAVRLVTIERGLDPRDHVLVAYGGAGPMHACRVADALDIARVLVPVASGVLCAAGAALGEARIDVARSVLRRAASGAEGDLETVFADLERGACREFADADASVERGADLRLVGQAFEITVPYASLASAVEAFHAEHERRYGFADRERELEMVAIRLALRGAAPDPARLPAPAGLSTVRGPALVPLAEATVVVPEGWEGGPAPGGVLDLRRCA